MRLGAVNGTYALDINSKWAITGLFIDSNSAMHGFLRYCNQVGRDRDCDADDSRFKTFDPPGSVFGTYPLSINSNGAITGYYNDSHFVRHGFVRNCNLENRQKDCEKGNGTIISFDVPGALSTTPSSINSEGSITGNYLGSDSVIHGFLRECKRENRDKDCDGDDSTFATFDAPGSIGTYPLSINSADAITGKYLDDVNTPHGFVRKRDGILTTFDVPGSVSTEALSINAGGAITGNFSDVNNSFHGFLRALDGTFIKFHVLGSINTFPSSINSEGEITGFYVDVNFASHGFLRAPNGKITTFDPPLSLQPLPQGINAGGAIAGYYINLNGNVHGFLRTPGEE